MTIFFTIFFVLILINAALLTFSILMNNRSQESTSRERSNAAGEKVYPLDLSSSEYRKAI